MFRHKFSKFLSRNSWLTSGAAYKNQFFLLNEFSHESFLNNFEKWFSSYRKYLQQNRKTENNHARRSNKNKPKHGMPVYNKELDKIGNG